MQHTAIRRMRANGNKCIGQQERRQQVDTDGARDHDSVLSAGRADRLQQPRVIDQQHRDGIGQIGAH